MYFNSKNNFPHGIMFHHFHDEKKYKKSQGSISKNDFYKIINFIGRKNIIDAQIFQQKFKEKKLKKNEVCLTFDDSVKNQIDIALPVLEDQKIKSFFFIYSSIFGKKPDNLEVFRYFRTNYFKSVNEFYNLFYQATKKDFSKLFFEEKNTIKKKN